MNFKADWGNADSAFLTASWDFRSRDQNWSYRLQALLVVSVDSLGAVPDEAFSTLTGVVLALFCFPISVFAFISRFGGRIERNRGLGSQ